VCDIITNPKNCVIGPRSYGTNEDIVSKMVTAVVRGHLINGVQPCAKHFPGHGDTTTDSHFALPKVDVPLNILQDREFRPFMKAFRSKCSMVMTAHIVNPQLDREFPATLSSKTIQGILRENLRHMKVVLTDDMEMKAITDHFGPDEAPILALQAGCDILIYRTEAAARKAYETLSHALDSGTLSPEVVLQAEARIRALKKEAFPQPYQPVTISDVGQKIGTAEHLAIIQKIRP